MPGGRPKGWRAPKNEVKRQAWSFLMKSLEDIAPREQEWHEPNNASRRMIVFLRLSNHEVDDVARIMGLSINTLYKHYSHELKTCMGVFRAELVGHAFERAFESDAMLGKMLDLYVAPHLNKGDAQEVPAIVDAPEKESREEWIARRKLIGAS